MTGENPILS